MALKHVLFIMLVNFLAKNAENDSYGYDNDSALVLVFLIHRHGDKTPGSSKDLSVFIKNPETLAQILDKYGSLELTPRGQYRGYQIGQFIRSRYSSLLSSRYNQSEIYIRSTDITRTKMTVLTSMAAVYPPLEDNWSRDINWTPVPYTTMDMESDYLFPFISCPKLQAYMVDPTPDISQYKNALEKWSRITHIDLVNNPEMVYYLHDYFTSIHSLGLPLQDDLEEIWPEIEEVASAVLDSIYGREDILPLLTGVLLDEFFNVSLALINGQDTPRFRVYSAHDLNVFGLTAASQVNQKSTLGIPKFGATFVLELRRVLETGQYVVLPVYVPDPDKEEVLFLQVEGCGNLLCDFDYFKNITLKFALDEDAWKRACKLDVGNSSLTG